MAIFRDILENRLQDLLVFASTLQRLVEESWLALEFEEELDLYGGGWGQSREQDGHVVTTPFLGSDPDHTARELHLSTVRQDLRAERHGGAQGAVSG